MSPDRYRQIKTILQAALEIDPARRAAFLDSACLDDPELKAEVQSLLDHDVSSVGFLEQPAVEGVAAANHLQPGSRMGPYEIVEQIGAGGMGEVYRARDSRFEREVAIKLLPAAFAHDPGPALAIRARGSRRRLAEPSKYPHDPRFRIPDRGALSGIGISQGRNPPPDLGEVRYHTQGCRGVCGPNRARVGRGPCQRHRSPRPEAREHLRASRWRHKDPGLRPGQVAGFGPG